MLRDVFYYGKKPNVHPREQFAVDLNDAREKASTEHFWIINEYCDYKGFDWDFDFDFLPDDELWTQDHNNVWPSIYDKDSGTWLCPKVKSEITVYRADVNPLTRKRIDQPRYYIETTLDDLVKEHPNEIFWALNKDIDYSTFNFNWEPHHTQVHYVQVFGSPDSTITQTYYVNSMYWLQGFRDFHYVTQDKLDTKTLHSLFVKPDVFFVDRHNDKADERYELLKEKFGSRISRTRYLNSWIDTIKRCTNKSTTKLCWILDSNLDYTDFVFEYSPNPWQMDMVHVFGTQWSHWGTTYLVNKNTFASDTKYVKEIEHLSNLNFVKTIRAKAVDCIYDVYTVDHNHIPRTENNMVPWQGNYLDTFKLLLERLPEKKDHYIWVCSSICDYSMFDFTYICDPFAKDQLHIFPSDNQEYGDTFLVDVNRLRALINDMTSLEDYKKINFNKHQRAFRLPPPVIVSNETHVETIQTEFDYPYAIFKTKDNQHLNINLEPWSLWNDNRKNIVVLSTGNTNLIVPKEAKKSIKNELYDYPHIIKSAKLATSINMDVVFMSNNETGAEERYQKLADVLRREPKWVNGVKGRENAIRKAAEISDTEWVFVVPGKLEIDSFFDFRWQPDRMQESKHYIFYATNPLNGLCYGHMAPVLYNKRLVLETIEYGLDFTMTKKHQVVPINAGIAHYNLDPLMTWRTSFREVIKLRVSNDEESLARLDTWLTVADGLNSEYSIKGAQDGITYYNEVNGDLSKLQLSFDWDWLKLRFEHNELYRA